MWEYFPRKLSRLLCVGRRRNPSKIPWDQKSVPCVEIPTRTFASVLTRMPIPSCLRGFSAMSSSLFLHYQGSLSTSVLLPSTWHFWDCSPASDLYPLPRSLPMPQLLPSLTYIHYLISLIVTPLFIHHLICSDCIIATDNSLWRILCEHSPREHVYESCWFLG